MNGNLKEEKKVFAANGIKNTGFYYTKSLIQGKYKLPILYCLQLDGPTRCNELLRKMETATFRSLTKALKELEADGLIIRKDYGEIPPPPSRVQPLRAQPLPGAGAGCFLPLGTGASGGCGSYGLTQAKRFYIYFYNTYPTGRTGRRLPGVRLSVHHLK